MWELFVFGEVLKQDRGLDKVFFWGWRICRMEKSVYFCKNFKRIAL
jgi:hypothetical protein